MTTAGVLAAEAQLVSPRDGYGNGVRVRPLAKRIADVRLILDPKPIAKFRHVPEHCFRRVGSRAVDESSGVPGSDVAAEIPGTFGNQERVAGAILDLAVPHHAQWVHDPVGGVAGATYALRSTRRRLVRHQAGTRAIEFRTVHPVVVSAVRSVQRFNRRAQSGRLDLCRLEPLLCRAF